MIEIKKQYNSSPVGEYLNKKREFHAFFENIYVKSCKKQEVFKVKPENFLFFYV